MVFSSLHKMNIANTLNTFYKNNAINYLISNIIIYIFNSNYNVIVLYDLKK